MKIAVLGLNHQTAPVALREQIAFDADALPAHLASLVALDGVAEGVVLSTCNRVEVYLASRKLDVAIAEVRDWLAATNRVVLEQLSPHLYTFQDAAAIRHGYRVAASLDSMMVGEPQILGQMKQAYHNAASFHATGPILNKFFHQAFRVAKRVRSETAIAENAVSVAYAAVTLARKIFGGLEGKICLLIGAGEMCELAARHLTAQGIAHVLVTNRTLQRAETLAASFAGHAFPLEQLADNLDRADIVISSTGSTSYLVDVPMVRAALKRRRQRPMFFIDIAVPRDLDPRIAEVESAFLYDMDDLNRIVERNRQERHQATEAADQIIAEEVPVFAAWIDALGVFPTIIDLRRRLEEIRDAEVARVTAKWPGLTDPDRKRVEELARLLVNKILHTPTSRLRQLGARRDGETFVDAARQIFALDATFATETSANDGTDDLE
ncbi:MAG: glutamyl-tRNA reductase [Magnetococcales bacterium]|nr:glutamyl-tRNA reductase [Magnetococcales bacterium]MBF0323337.1 glutamyl-tRNA reductase [Magnetococcales bacterium]